jgi:hypothetical protein
LRERVVDQEKRKGGISIPENLKEILNEAQWQALSGIKYSGWELRFLRKPVFQAPELVIQNSSDGRTGILGVDGKIKIQKIKLREHEQLQANDLMRAGSAAHYKELTSLRADNEKLLADMKESQLAEARLTEQIEQQRGELCESAEKLNSLYAQVQSDTVEMQLLQDQYAALQEQYADVVRTHKLEIEQLYKQSSS